MITIADPDKLTKKEFARLMREATPSNPVKFGCVTWLGMARDDDPIYQGGWNYIMGRQSGPTLNHGVRQCQWS